MTSAERREKRYQRRKAAREKKRRERLDRYDDFNRVSDPMKLMRANYDARQGVMFKASVARYSFHTYHNSFYLSNDMRNGKDVCDGFYSFTVIERGKVRPIHSLHYRERVIRRSVCVNALVLILSSNLIYDNGASLKGKGVSFAADRCETHLHGFYRETGNNDGWVILIDFRNFFGNILHQPLFDYTIDRLILDTRLNKLTHDFISAPDHEKPPEERGKGLYIGPEDSQIYAVAYPNAIDHKIKDQWRLRYYARYMDDSYIIVKTKEEAQTILKRLLAEYEKYGIIVNPKKTHIQKLSQGFTFLKTRYFLTDNGAVIRKPCRDAIVRERRKMKKQYGLVLAGEMTQDQLTQSYMSWRGAMLKHDAYRSVRRMDALFFSLCGLKPWRKKHKKSYKECTEHDYIRTA